jgi:hypothetical protein
MGNSVTVWYGRLPLRDADRWFRRLVLIGQRYPDEHARFLDGKRDVDVSLDAFLNEVRGLREIVPSEASVLIDELEHRWRFPEAPSLYAISSMVIGAVPLHAAGAPLAAQVLSIKLGKAKRSLAPRLSAYVTGGKLQRGRIVSGTVELRLVVFGSGEGMVRERDLLGRAREHAPRLTSGPDPRAFLTAESYYSETLLHHLLESLPPGLYRTMAADVFYGRGADEQKRLLLEEFARDSDPLVARPAGDYLRSLALRDEAARS